MSHVKRTLRSATVAMCWGIALSLAACAEPAPTEVTDVEPIVAGGSVTLQVSAQWPSVGSLLTVSVMVMPTVHGEDPSGLEATLRFD